MSYLNGARTRRAIACAAVAALAALWAVPSAADSTGRQGVDVTIPADGLWTARLVGFDPGTVRSVTYFWRDGKKAWRHTNPEFIPPFSTPLAWWEADNSDFEAVTAHVELNSGKVIKDPGGWHWVDGHHVNPRGSLTAVTDGHSYGAAYAPSAEAGQVAGVEFWIRESGGSWSDAGGGHSIDGHIWSLGPLLGPGSKPFAGTADAVSVHVIWPSGKQSVDPAPWVATFERQPVLPQTALPVSAGATAGSVSAPSRSLTPGTSVPGVSAADVCRPGWSAAHRHVTHDQYIGVYAAYGIAYPELAGAYELDHLIPIELGGSNDSSNLWPQPAAGMGFHQKDVLENRLHDLVCAGQLDLATAQKAITSGWESAYAKYGAVPPPSAAPLLVPRPGTPAPVPPAPVLPAQPVPAPPPATPAPLPATGLCGAPNNPWGYNLCGRGGLVFTPPGNFCSYFGPCVSSFWTATNGYVAQCANGRWTHSGGVRSVCNKDGGEARSLSSG